MRVRPSLIRFLLEAAFLVLVAATAGLAGLSALWIGIVTIGAGLLVALVERGSRRRRSVPAEARAEAQQTEPEPEPRRGVFWRREPADEPGPEPELQLEPVVPLARRDSSPRSWNLWELERLAEEKNGVATRSEERGLLLLHLRQFADASGHLPPEFDTLIREAFGADLRELVS